MALQIFIVTQSGAIRKAYSPGDATQSAIPDKYVFCSDLIFSWGPAFLTCSITIESLLNNLDALVPNGLNTNENVWIYPSTDRLWDHAHQESWNRRRCNYYKVLQNNRIDTKFPANARTLCSFLPSTTGDLPSGLTR